MRNSYILRSLGSAFICCVSAATIAIQPHTTEEVLRRGFFRLNRPIVVDAEFLYPNQQLARENGSFGAVDLDTLALAMRRKKVEVQGVVVFRRVGSRELFNGLSGEQALAEWLSSLSGPQRDQLFGEGLVLERGRGQVPAAMIYLFQTGDVQRSMVEGEPVRIKLGASLIGNAPGDTMYFPSQTRAQHSLPPVPESDDRPIPGWWDGEETTSGKIVFESDGEMISFRDLAFKVRSEAGLRLSYDARLADTKFFIKGKFDEEQLVQSLSAISKTIPVAATEQEPFVSQQISADPALLEVAIKGEGFSEALLDAVRSNALLTPEEWGKLSARLGEALARRGAPNAPMHMTLNLAVSVRSERPRSGNEPISTMHVEVRP